jgi:hypothetical protein
MFFRVAPAAERDQKLWVDLPDVAALRVITMMNLQPCSVGEAASAFVPVTF